MVVTIGLIALPLSTAHGAPPATSHAEALRLFDQSRAEYREGHFQRAVDLLLEARSLERAAVLLYNLARAYEGLGDFPHAIESYVTYLEEEPTARDRGAIEERVRTLRREIEQRESLEREREQALKSRPEPAVKSPAPARPRALGIAPWVLAGAGVASVGVGVAFALTAEARHEASVADPIQRSAHDKQQDAERSATIANVCFVVGGVAIASAVAWAIVHLRGSRSTQTFSGGGIDLRF